MHNELLKPGTSRDGEELHVCDHSRLQVRKTEDTRQTRELVAVGGDQVVGGCGSRWEERLPQDWMTRGKAETCLVCWVLLAEGIGVNPPIVGTWRPRNHVLWLSHPPHSRLVRCLPCELCREGALFVSPLSGYWFLNPSLGLRPNQQWPRCSSSRALGTWIQVLSLSFHLKLFI